MALDVGDLAYPTSWSSWTKYHSSLMKATAWTSSTWISPKRSIKCHTSICWRDNTRRKGSGCSDQWWFKMVESLRAGIHKGEQGARYDKQNDPQQRQKNSTQFIQILGKTSSGILFTCLVSTLHTIKRTNSYWRKFSIDLPEWYLV